MQKIPVQSRIVNAVYFSQDDGKLRIRFKNGEERLFDGVPEAVVQEMVTAESPGSYYIENIRKNFTRLAA
jgi:hypothetical protein